MKWDEPAGGEVVVDEPPKKVITEAQREHMDAVSFNFGKGIKPVTSIPARQNTVMSLFGYGGSGKTYFSCTAPLPIIVIDTEDRLKLVTDQLPQDIQDQIFQFSMIEYGASDTGEVDYSGMIERFRTEILDAAAEMTAQGIKGTIVIDSMSEILDWYDLWLVKQKGVRLGEDGQPLPFEKKRTKNEIRRILDIFRVTKWNIIMTFKEKQLWGDSGIPIDDYAPEWSKDLIYVSDFVVNIRRIGTRREFRLIKNSYGNKLDIPLNNVDWNGFLKTVKEHSGG